MSIGAPNSSQLSLQRERMDIRTVRALVRGANTQHYRCFRVGLTSVQVTAHVRNLYPFCRLVMLASPDQLGGE